MRGISDAYTAPPSQPLLVPSQERFFMRSIVHLGGGHLDGESVSSKLGQKKTTRIESLFPPRILENDGVAFSAENCMRSNDNEVDGRRNF
jgi:hypothetical protein